MIRRKNTSKNVALNTTIQMTGVLRRHCVNAYNTAVHELGIDTLRRVVATLREAPRLQSNSVEHHFLSNYAFFAADEIVGKRRVFVRQFQYLVGQDMRAFRERIMAAPFAAWECVGNESAARDGFLWKPLGLPDRSEHEHDAPTFSPVRVRALTDANAVPLGAKLGDIRAGWLVNLEDLPVGNSGRIQRDLAGCSALLYSIAVPPQAAARLQKAASQRGWHGEIAPGQFEFMRADYERDILTQVMSPNYAHCGLDAYYFLPMRLRKSFPKRFFTELTRKIAHGSAPENQLWHIEVARACDEAARARLLAWFDEARTAVEQRVNYYSTDTVELASLRRIASDADLLDWMRVPHDLQVDLGAFPALESQPIELLDLAQEWLEKTQLKPHIPISRARKTLEDRHHILQKEFEESVTRHLIRLRWVSLLKARRAEDADEDAPSANSRRSSRGLKGYAVGLPDYDDLRQVARELFGPTLGERPIADFLAPLKGRLAKLEAAMHYWREWDELEEKQTFTLADLPMSKSRLGAAAGIGPTSVKTIEALLLEEMLAWPRALDARATNIQQAEEQLADGLDELGDLFG